MKILEKIEQIVIVFEGLKEVSRRLSLSNRTRLTALPSLNEHHESVSFMVDVGRTENALVHRTAENSKVYKRRLVPNNGNETSDVLQ